MKDLMEFITDRPQLHDYFPELEEIPKQGKAWIKNMLRILCENDFRNWVNERCRLHREKNDQQRNLNVENLSLTIDVGSICARDCCKTF